MNKVIELIDNGWDIKIYNHPKRIDGEFVVKVCWEAKTGSEEKESVWGGFDTAKDAINDLINKCK